MLVDTQPPASPNLHDVTGQPGQTAQPKRQSTDFRHGIANLARGVAVLTTNDEHGEWYGVTTTGVCVLSIEPSALVVCVRRRSKLGMHLPRTRRFCVNALSSRQRAVAEVFAGRRGVPLDKFNHGRWTPGSTGVPVLADALASFECEVDLLYGYPNHMVVVGGVRDVALPEERLEPLVYASGQLAPLASPGGDDRRTA